MSAHIKIYGYVVISLICHVMCLNSMQMYASSRQNNNVFH